MLEVASMDYVGDDKLLRNPAHQDSSLCQELAPYLFYFEDFDAIVFIIKTLPASPGLSPAF
jgi:hypothetical protein